MPERRADKGKIRSLGDTLRAGGARGAMPAMRDAGEVHSHKTLSPPVRFRSGSIITGVPRLIAKQMDIRQG
jgi:hypothetical protein